MKYTTLRTVIDGEGTHVPGSIIEIQDKSEAARLTALKAVEPILMNDSQPDSQSGSQPDNKSDSKTDTMESIEELMCVEGVTQEIAIELIKHGIDSIGKLQESSTDTLVSLKIKNVGKATAEKIIAFAIENFEVED
jgi:hypothetical protein